MSGSAPPLASLGVAGITTVATFDPTDATAAAGEDITKRKQELIDQLTAEAEAAEAAAQAYARHLTEGGDPTKQVGVDHGRRFGSSRTEIMSQRLGLDSVYRVWNEARGSRNTIHPFSSPEAWKVAEALFESFGTPMLLADLKKVERNLTPDIVRRTLVRIADGTKCEVVPRRTKIDGKVAYFIRDRRDGDEDEMSDSGYYKPAPGRSSDEFTQEKP